MPRALPPEVLGCWSADQVTVSAIVAALSPAAAAAAVEALVPELACGPRASVTVRAAGKDLTALAAGTAARRP